MRESSKTTTPRREFFKSTGRIAAGSAVAAGAVPRVHAAQDNTIRVALVGCGGRGTGAAANALSVKNGPIKLVAMADIFEQKLSGSYRRLKRRFADQVVTYDEILNHDHEFAPDVDKLTMDSPAPLQAGSDGKYPVPLPGINKNREY